MRGWSYKCFICISAHYKWQWWWWWKSIYALWQSSRRCWAAETI